MQESSQGVSSFEGTGRWDGKGAFWKQVWGSMTKAVVGSFAAIIFGVVILMASIMAVTDPASVYPHADGDLSWHENAETGEVEYYLPYPGVLPDSPLYKIKAVRDRVWLWLTWDAEKKARRELLYADKRINAATWLVDGGKEVLGVTTVTKAEKYLGSAVDRAAKLSAAGKDVKSLLNTLITASAKHLELLDGLKEKVTGERVEAVEQMRVMTKAVHVRAEQALVESK